MNLPEPEIAILIIAVIAIIVCAAVLCMGNTSPSDVQEDTGQYE